MALREIIFVSAAGVALACSVPLGAQQFPGKTIRIVTATAGSGTDFAARLFAQGMAAPLGQQVIVENRPSGVAPGQAVAQSAPDGYTLLLTSSTLWLAPLMQNNIPYDPLKDFSPVALTTRAPAILVVHPSLPVKSVRELISFARSRPGQLNYSSSGTGSSSHLAGELFKVMGGVNIVRIPYAADSQEKADLLAGQVQLTFGGAASVAPHVKAGRLRALAVTSAERSALLPQLPTVAAEGLQGYEAVSLQGVFAPAKTPAQIINRLNQEIVRVLYQPDVKEKFLTIVIEPVGGSAEQFGATLATEVTRWSKVIKVAGIRVE